MRLRPHITLWLAMFVLAAGTVAQVPNLNAVHLVNVNTGYIAGTGGIIYKTVDGGANWFELTSSTPRSLYDVHFLDNSTGGVVGGEVLVSANVISRTENGGVGWTNQPPGVSTLLSGISHLTSSTAVAVGNGGLILRTTDAGLNWATVTSGVTDNLKKSSFLNTSTGYVAGWGGTILRTDDGGASWARQTTGTTTILYDIDFVTTNIGTAVGYSGAIFRTTDGGSSWSTQTSGTVESLFGVDFIDQNTGFIAGSTGLILKTTDGGSSWSRVYPGTFQNLNGVSFLDQNNGVIVGSSRTILLTSDGGASWTQAAVDSTPQSPPPAPVPVSPFDGETGIEISPTLSWDGSSGATSYRLQVSMDSLFTSILMDDATITGLSRMVTGLNYGWLYYWRVNAANSGGSGPWSSVSSFTTEENAQVTIESIPAGRSFNIDGVSYLTSHTFTFNPGETHTISTDTIQSEVAGGRFIWKNWSDAGALSHEITFPGTDTTVTVSFARQYFLTTGTGAGGSVMPAPGWHDSGMVVGVTATPDTGYNFALWTGTGEGSYSGFDNPAIVTMNSPIQQLAEFTPGTIPVMFLTEPPGRVIIIDGVSYTAPRTFTWTIGSSHTISTDSLQDASPGARYRWMGWSDGGQRTHTVAPSLPDTFVADFDPVFLLTMEADPGGSVTPVTAWYDSGHVVALTAIPLAGYSFTGWTGSGTGAYSGPDNPGHVTLSGPATERAGFTLTPVRVIVRSSFPERSFIVDGTTYTGIREFVWSPAEAHTLSVDSPQGDSLSRYLFSGWSDGGLQTHTVAPMSDTVFTVSFSTQYKLTMRTGVGEGSLSPAGGWHDAGQSVEIFAVPDPPYLFGHWTGSGTGSYSGPNNPATVTMGGPLTETANFTPGMISVEVNTSPTGLDVTVDGTVYTSPHVFTWTAGSAHSISTDSLQKSITTGVRYRWRSWSDAGIRTHTVLPVSDTTFVATFSTQYLLVMQADSGGVVSPPTGWYPPGRSVDISALPDSGFEFAGWTGSGAGSYTGENSPVYLTVLGPITETAHFSPVIIHPPVVTTGAAGSVTSQSVVLNGFVHPSGDSTSAWYEWGTDSLLAGSDLTTPRQIGSGNTPVAFGESVSGLAPQTTYYFRISAQNSGGTRSGVILNFTTDTVSVAGPEFAVTKSLLDFGTVRIPGLKQDSITVRNLGDSPLSVTDITTTSATFDVSLNSTNVPPGGSRSFYVTFSPETKPVEQAWLIFTHNDPGSPDSVSLSGSGYYGAIPVVTPDSLTFVYFDSLGPQTLDLFVHNDGDMLLIVDTLESTNGFYTANMPDAEIAPGDSQLVSVTCEPDSTGPGNGFIVLRYTGTAVVDSVVVTYDIVLDVTSSSGIPGELNLRQNYPNPFNPRTRIEYALPYRAEVTLKVYNVLGGEVAILTQGVAGAGEYRVDFDAADLPSGVYFYRLVALEVGPGGAVMSISGRMMLIR